MHIMNIYVAHHNAYQANKDTDFILFNNKERINYAHKSEL